MSENLMYYGDNLDILRRYIKDETVDLIYLDPPFNSNVTYNVLFGEQNGSQAAAQIKAFEDTWRWDEASARAYQETVEAGGRVSQALQGLYRLLGSSNMMAYLAMMAPRLVQLHRTLKSTGSIYLHCDPTASHYLKMVMDATFGPVNFKNEIVWQRALAKALASRALPNNHDIILCYQKTPAAFYNANAMFQPYDEANLDAKTAGKYYHRDHSGRRYRLDNLTNPNPDRPNLTYDFLGVTRVWRWTKERMRQAYDSGLIVQSGPGRVPQLKRYLDEQRGRPLSDVWTDIPPINSMAQERLGYPTQKPEALLARIINASSNEGDLVLDPFCGCGTTITASQRLKRRWIGIDITHLAITLIKHRLRDAFGDQATYEVMGEPVSLPDADALAATDPYQFQWWALGLVGARPVEQKKGSDKGIDGRLYFHDEAEGGKTKQVILSVKAGHTSVAHVHELRGVMEREQAQIGVLISMAEPTQPMRSEAASAGFYDSPGWKTRHPRLQILTVEELLGGKTIDMPAVAQQRATFKRAPKAKADHAQQLALDE